MDLEKFIAEAETRKRKVLAEQVRLSEEAKRLDAFIESANALRDLPAPLANAPCVETVPRRVATKRPSPIMTKTIEAADAIWEATGGPMNTRPISELMERQGIEIGGKDAVATLSARLHNAGKYKNHRGLGWWFKDRPLPDEEVSLLGSDSEAAANNLGGNAAASVLTKGDGSRAAALDSDPDRE